MKGREERMRQFGQPSYTLLMAMRVVVVVLLFLTMLRLRLRRRVVERVKIQVDGVHPRGEWVGTSARKTLALSAATVVVTGVGISILKRGVA
jgi:hypothetical protein